MAQVNVTINGHQYRMACLDGQEDHLMQLAQGLGDEELQAFVGERLAKFKVPTTSASRTCAQSSVKSATCD